MSAKETTLGDLHEQLAAKYLKLLRKPDECTPALLNSIVKFLKDNGITCQVGDEEMDALSEVANNVIKMPFAIGED